MDKKKRAGIAAAALLTVGAFGAMAYGAESERVTIGMDASLESTETEQERVTFNEAADVTEETEAVEEETTEAVEEETTEAVEEETTEAAEEETTEAAEEESTEAAEEETTEAADVVTADDIAEIDTDDVAAENYLPNIKQITKDVMPAIVAITNVGVENVDFFGRSYQQDTESAGSGIIVAKSETELLIATNNHVVEKAEQLTVCFVADVEHDGDQLVSAQVKGTDSTLDLAVIAVKLEDIPQEVADQIGIIQLGDSDDVQVGDWAIAIGNALGYGQSVTFGIVSALDREISVSTDNGVVTNSMIQTDAAINFGNSGGALLDEKGHLIGINSAKAAETGVEGMGYAIPINTAKPILEDLMNQTTRSKVDQENAGALGVSVVDVSEEARQIYSIPAGAYVYELTEGSAADEAGIEQGDIITKLESTAISSKDELLDRMQYYEAGETVDVTVKRIADGGYVEKVISVTLGRKADMVGFSDSKSQNKDSSDSSDNSDDGNDKENQKEQSQQDDNGSNSFDDDYYNQFYGNNGMSDFFRYFGGGF